MKIAIDIDKTIFDCNSVFYQYINTYHINQNLNDELKYKEIDLNEYKACVGKVIKHFSRMHNPDFYSVQSEAPDVIKKWIDHGDEIILLSSRPAFKNLVGALLVCLQNYKIPFSKIIVKCNNKAVYCKKENVDVLIDDSHFICNNAKKIGVNTIWHIAKFGEFKKYPPIEYFAFSRSWKELDEMISQLRTDKKITKIR